MKHSSIFAKNQYLVPGRSTGSNFSVLMDKVIKNNQKELHELNDVLYLHGILTYGNWREKNVDIFRYLTPKQLKRLQKNNMFFVFDAGYEGFSPIYNIPFFKILYNNCKKYSIDPGQIIFVSSNCKDEQTMHEYSNKENLKPFCVFSFLAFEGMLKQEVEHGYNHQTKDIAYSKKMCLERHSNKYLSSLSRINREYRTLGTFLLFNSSVRDKALISHDTKVRHAHEPHLFRKQYGLIEYTDAEVNKWINALPLIVDHDNFNVNWAIPSVPYRDIHHQTIFQIVNETLVDDDFGTSLFYSEKTFRPIANFQPMLIYGQVGCNHYLKEWGYKLYDDWFDLSFDLEPDPVLRYKKLLKTVIDASQKLDQMTREERVAWRYKNEDVLIHNFETIQESEVANEKMLTFLKGIRNNRRS